MGNTTRRILLIHSDRRQADEIREMLAGLTADEQPTVTWVAVPDDALGRVRREWYDLILLQATLPEAQSVATYTRLSEHAPSVPVILITRPTEEATAFQLVCKGAQDYLVEGEFDSRQLCRVIRHAIERAHMLQELRASQQSLQATKEQLETTLRELNEQLQTARLVQRSLLPDMFAEFTGIEVGSIFLPCSSIGGDLFDIIRIDDTHIGLLILDVAGHGPHAALISAMAKISFTRNLTRYIDPGATLDAVNKELSRYMPHSLYLTAYIGVIDLATDSLTYCSAGHPPVLCMSPSRDRVEMLDSRGFFIGLLPDCPYASRTAAIAPGDTLLLYTDGLVESIGPRDFPYGRDRLQSLLRGLMDLSPYEIAATVMSDLKSFTASESQIDDIAILVVKYRGNRRNGQQP